MEQICGPASWDMSDLDPPWTGAINDSNHARVTQMLVYVL